MFWLHVLHLFFLLNSSFLFKCALTPFFLSFLCPLPPPLCFVHTSQMCCHFFFAVILLRLLQTDVLSHHLQRNLIYMDSQVRAYSRLSPSQVATVWNFTKLNILWGTGTFQCINVPEANMTWHLRVPAFQNRICGFTSMIIYFCFPVFSSSFFPLSRYMFQYLILKFKIACIDVYVGAAFLFLSCVQFGH